MPDGMTGGGNLHNADTKPYAPPHNIEAEQCVLGAVLFENRVHEDIGFLKPEHFYDPVHARIYEAASSLIASNTLADPVTLKDRMAGDAGLQEVSGEGAPVNAYLVELMANAPDTAAAIEYARMVRDYAVRRSLVDVGRSIVATATTPLDASPAAMIEQAEGELFALAEHGVRQKALTSVCDFAMSVYDDIEAATKTGGVVGVSTGLRDLDRKLGGLHRSDLIILAGRPSMGKSALALNIAVSCAERERRAREQGEADIRGGIVAFFSLEMSRDQLVARELAARTHISTTRMRQGKVSQEGLRDIHAAAESIACLPLHIDDTGGIGVEQIAARARRLKRREGLALVVVDYLQLVSTAKRADNRTHEVSHVTSRLKAMAKELDVPVLALSQLSRQVEQRDDKKPQLADLRESGSIEQDADAVMFCYREAYYHERTEPTENTPEHAEWAAELERLRDQAEVIISKQRHGPIGTVKLGFDAERTTFFDLATQAQEAAYDG